MLEVVVFGEIVEKSYYSGGHFVFLQFEGFSMFCRLVIHQNRIQCPLIMLKKWYDNFSAQMPLGF